MCLCGKCCGRNGTGTARGGNRAGRSLSLIAKECVGLFGFLPPLHTLTFFLRSLPCFNATTMMLNRRQQSTAPVADSSIPAGKLFYIVFLSSFWSSLSIILDLIVSARTRPHVLLRGTHLRQRPCPLVALCTRPSTNTTYHRRLSFLLPHRYSYTPVPPLKGVTVYSLLLL